MFKLSNKNNQNLIKPIIDNFNKIAAKIILESTVASTCASGNHTNIGNDGIFILRSVNKVIENILRDTLLK